MKQAWGSPFLEQGKELYAIATKNVVDNKVLKTVQSVQEVGKKLYDSFITDHLQGHILDIMDTIKKNSLTLLHSQPRKTTSKAKTNVVSLQND